MTGGGGGAVVNLGMSWWTKKSKEPIFRIMQKQPENRKKTTQQTMFGWKDLAKETIFEINWNHPTATAILEGIAGGWSYNSTWTDKRQLKFSVVWGLSRAFVTSSFRILAFTELSSFWYPEMGFLKSQNRISWKGLERKASLLTYNTYQKYHISAYLGDCLLSIASLQ